MSVVIDSPALRSSGGNAATPPLDSTNYLSSLSRILPFAVQLLLIWFASRIPALNKMPLFVDEGVHVTRAIQVWHGHPFWFIGDGKIINHWAIALFYPQHAPAFVGRIATVLVVMIGLAAGYALARRYFGRTGGVLAAVVWIACPYLFFYERTALIDAETGALGVVVIWASLRLARTGTRRDALLTGIILAIAALFKLTDAPFAISVFLIVIGIGAVSLGRRVVNLAIIALTGLALFAVPTAYAMAHQGFDVLAGWLGVGGGQGGTIGANLEQLWTTLVGYDSVVWTVGMGVGLLSLLMLPIIPGSPLRRSEYRVLLVAGLTPLALIVLLGANAMPRHFVSGIPIALTLSSGGIGALIDRLISALRRPALPRLAIQTAASVALMAGLVPFAQTAYAAPAKLALPPIERDQYLSGYTSGYGLRAAVLHFPQTVGPVGSPIIGSMYPYICTDVANSYDTLGYNMRCTDAPGLDVVRAAVAAAPSQSSVYVLAQSPPIGLDGNVLRTLPGVVVTQAAAYPRPGETKASSFVVLWRVEKR